MRIGVKVSLESLEITVNVFRLGQWKIQGDPGCLDDSLRRALD